MDNPTENNNTLCEQSSLAMCDLGISSVTQVLLTYLGLPDFLAVIHIKPKTRHPME